MATLPRLRGRCVGCLQRRSALSLTVLQLPQLRLRPSPECTSGRLHRRTERSARRRARHGRGELRGRLDREDARLNVDDWLDFVESVARRVLDEGELLTAGQREKASEILAKANE